MPQSLADEIFGLISDTPTEEVALPSGRKVIASELTGLEWLEVQLERNKWCQEHDEKVDPLWDARIAVRSLNDGNGNLVFKAGDEAKIMGLPKHHLERIMAAVNKVNYHAVEMQEELKKNSPTLKLGSLGDSQETSEKVA